METVDLYDEDERAIADAVNDKFDVSSSDEEIVRKVKKAAPRKLGHSIKEGSTKTGNGKPVPMKGAAVKKKFVQSSDDEKPMKRGRKVVDSGDDDSDFEVLPSLAQQVTLWGELYSGRKDRLIRTALIMPPQVEE